MPQENAQIDEEMPVFSWKTGESISYKKGPLWFVLIVFIAIMLIIFFLWQSNWTAAGVIAAAAFALLSFSRSEPKKIVCSLYHSGFVIDKKAYRYTDLKSFWMVPGAQWSVRFLRPDRFSLHINMPIADEDPEQVRLFLSKYLPEETDRGEDVSDILSRWFKL